MDNVTISREELQRLIDNAVNQRIGSQFAAMEDQIRQLQQTVASHSANVPEDRATLVVFSGEMDTIFAACTIAAGAVAMGMEASMFFTFWGPERTAHRSQVQWQKHTRKNGCHDDAQRSRLSSHKPHEHGRHGASFFQVSDEAEKS